MAVRARRALVTGGGRGIGRAIALGLAADGVDVAVSARSADQLDEVVAAGADLPGSLVALPADLADLDVCRALGADAAEALGGHVNVLVNNAGVSLPGVTTELQLEAWELSLRVNVTAPFLLCQALLPAMASEGWGRVISIGSLYSRYGVPYAAAYTASKHAILGLTRVVAQEFARQGITANTIAPGFVDTEMVRDEAIRVGRPRGLDPDETIKRFLRNAGQAIGRLVEAGEVAGLVCYLASEQASAITAQAINVDGGAHQG
jgi:NAD(P)-dependent dehydrogenase (short-subunit alcohol dehydrogenase family)